MVEDYVKRKHRQVPVKYLLPELQPILRETHGVILYQEQVMGIASKVAGFSLGQADLLRRAMGKKKDKEMQQQKDYFVEGAVKRGVSKNKATELFNLCAKFAGYGLNKSHSTAYGVISYQTAYLKANYTIEFMAALLTSVMGNTDKVTAYINECRRLGIKVLPPDINESERTFTVTRDGVRFGLSAVKNVGIAAIDAIIAAKERDGFYHTLADFFRRSDSRVVNKKVIESLVKAGAFDTLADSRSSLLGNFARLMDRAATELREKASGQTALFEMPAAEADTAWTERPDNGMVEVKEFPPEQLLRMEKEMLGLYISAHPLEHMRDSLEGQVTHRIADISEMREGENVKIGGILQECRRITTRRGDNMLIASLEDLSGSIGMVVFPKSYEKYAAALNNDAVLVVKGKINRDMRTEEFNIVVDSVEPMAELEKLRFLQIELVGVRDQQVLIQMKDILGFFRGEDPVYINMEGRKIELGSGFRVDINPELVGQLEGLLGTGAVNVEFKAVPKIREKSEVIF